ncbi:MAG: MFS transporter [Microbacteriaceae bacterium]
MSTSPATSSGTPARAGLVLAALILSALVCNINLAVANVALPSIGREFGAGQVELNVMAVGCTLGLAMSVLYFGAIGDRYGRKMMLSIGLSATLVTSVMAAFAPSMGFLIASRLLTGLAAGMAYPTTLALITALWAAGAKRTTAIALWSGISAAAASLGPAIAGVLLEHFWWGSVFLIAWPLAAIALVLVLIGVPSGVNESTEKVDHLGGVISVVMIAALVLGVNFVAVKPAQVFAIGAFVVTVVLGILFVWRQRTAENPLYDLSVAKRRLFWVPAIAGMIIFGTMMGSAFVGQQFLQDVLGLSTSVTGLTSLPAALALVVAAPISARLLMARGSRTTMVSGYIFVLAGLALMFLWNEHTGMGPVIGSYVLTGIGAGLALTPASRSITGSTPVRRVGMASGTSDLQRDLGGSVMTSLLGAMLAGGFASAFAKQIADSPESADVTQKIAGQLQASFSSAAEVAKSFPQYADQITAAAKQAFESGSQLAFTGGIVLVLVGAALVFFMMPNKAGEATLEAQYEAEDAAATA